MLRSVIGWVLLVAGLLGTLMFFWTGVAPASSLSTAITVALGANLPVAIVAGVTVLIAGVAVLASR